MGEPVVLKNNIGCYKNPLKEEERIEFQKEVERLQKIFSYRGKVK